MEQQAPWGYHLLLDCTKGNEGVRNKEKIAEFVKDLVDTIDMIAYGEPLIEHFATHCPEKAGFSLVQLIETSNITAHFVDKNSNGYIDIFSCKPFKNEDAVACVQRHFSFENVDVKFVTRNAGE